MSCVTKHDRARRLRGAAPRRTRSSSSRAGLRVDRRERLVHQQRPRAGRPARGRSRHAAACRPRAATGTSWRRRGGPISARTASARVRPFLASTARSDGSGNMTFSNDGQPGKQRAAVVLEDDRHFSRRCVHRLAVEQHDALGRWHQTADEAEERRLAAPRRTHDCQELALADVERDPGEG